MTYTYSLLNLSTPNLESRIQPGLDTVEEKLRQAATSSRGLIADLTSHLAMAGGKRMRPLLTLVSAQLGTPDRAVSADVIAAAAVVELTHLASLYHDDVMDSAPTRRGVDAVQHVWGNNRAILAGDVLFARASQLATQLGIESVQHQAHIFERMCLGQLNESFGPEDGDDPVDFHLQVLADKTGALVAAAAYLGALHGGADQETAAQVEIFGEKIGVAFQIADDVLDLNSDRKESGKTPGTDLKEGVDTLPVLLLRQQAAAGTIDAAGEEILWGLAKDLEDEENLARVVQGFREHPVLDETKEMSRAWADEALTALDGFPESEAKTALEAFADQMIDRHM